MGELIPKGLIESARPEYWITFLEPYEAYCRERGLCLDPRGAQADRDGWYRALQQVVRADDAHRPAPLRAACKRIAHMADEGGRERLVSVLRRTAHTSELTAERRTHLELALAVFDHHPRLFEEASLLKQAAAKDNFWEFVPVRPTRVVDAPSPSAVEELRRGMSEHHFGYGHTAYCRLDIDASSYEVRFVFSRGNAYRSHCAVTPGEAREQLAYTAEIHDVAILDRVTGRLSLACGRPVHTQFARELFGRVLYGDPHYFGNSAIYTGAPLLNEGDAALSTRGVSGLRRVVLRSVGLRRPNGKYYTAGDEHDSVFPEDAELLRWFADMGCVVRSMRFDLYYGQSDRAHPLEIHVPNHIIFDRQHGEPVVRAFLAARGFAYAPDDHLDLAA